MKKIEKFGIRAFDVYNNDDLVDRMIEMNDKINEIIEFVNKLDDNNLKFHKDE